MFDPSLFTDRKTEDVVSDSLQEALLKILKMVNAQECSSSKPLIAHLSIEEAAKLTRHFPFVTACHVVNLQIQSSFLLISIFKGEALTDQWI